MAPHMHVQRALNQPGLWAFLCPDCAPARPFSLPPHSFPQGCCAQTEDPSGCGAAPPSQGRWDPDSLRPALRLGGQAWVSGLTWEPGRPHPTDGPLVSAWGPEPSTQRGAASTPTAAPAHPSPAGASPTRPSPPRGQAWGPWPQDPPEVLFPLRPGITLCRSGSNLGSCDTRSAGPGRAGPHRRFLKVRLSS